MVNKSVRESSLVIVAVICCGFKAYRFTCFHHQFIHFPATNVISIHRNGRTLALILEDIDGAITRSVRSVCSKGAFSRQTLPHTLESTIMKTKCGSMSRGHRCSCPKSGIEQEETAQLQQLKPTACQRKFGG